MYIGVERAFFWAIPTINNKWTMGGKKTLSQPLLDVLYQIHTRLKNPNTQRGFMIGLSTEAQTWWQKMDFLSISPLTHLRFLMRMWSFNIFPSPWTALTIWSDPPFWSLTLFLFPISFNHTPPPHPAHFPLLSMSFPHRFLHLLLCSLAQSKVTPDHRLPLLPRGYVE